MSMLTRFRGTFTNREIISAGIITFVFWAVAGFHWLGLVTGVFFGIGITWLLRREINANYRIRPFFSRISKRSKKSD